MTTGALITGNTAVVKPASTTPLTAHAFYDASRRRAFRTASSTWSRVAGGRSVNR